MNAYADERFNKDFDKKMNYKSRTILCVPIVDEHGRTLGKQFYNIIKITCFLIDKFLFLNELTWLI